MFHTHTSLSHTSLSHTMVHTQLCHTPSFTYNFVTHYLSHTTFTFTHISLPHTTLSHTIFHTHLGYTPSFTHIFVTHHLSHTSLSHAIFHTQRCHTPSSTHIFVTHHLSHTFLLHTLFATHPFPHTHTTFPHATLVTHHLSHTTSSHTTFSIIDHTPPPLSILPSLSRCNFVFWLMEDVGLWGYPVLYFSLWTPNAWNGHLQRWARCIRCVAQIFCRQSWWWTNLWKTARCRCDPSAFAGICMHPFMHIWCVIWYYILVCVLEISYDILFGAHILL